MPGLIPLRMSTLIPASKITFSFPDDKPNHTSWEPTPPVPTTHAQWKKALAEVKRDFVNRKYRQCSMRCNEILDNMKDSHKPETARLIYIRFYAASALEMQVRSLQHNSPYRTKLLLQARDHYRVAADLIKEDDAAKRRPSSRSLSPMPSLHTPFGSDASVSTVSTRISSPSLSISSLDSCLKNPNSRPKPKKRVAFCDVPSYEPSHEASYEDSYESSYEPMVRPDSPTLGFDDDWGVRQPTPEPPALFPQPLRLGSGRPQFPLPSPTNSEFSTVPDDDDNYFDIPTAADSFLHARSVHHYCTVLSGLQRQIASHLEWLERDIAAAENPKPTQLLSEEMRALELRTRIERLRANGWKRQRFDFRRYEALRENALADIA
ncbi:uncharacterized protein TRIVIDRAFT_196278 [Trichoderma virens Gv29-8]|uniref:Uncharacterized protein n=1 Tax=Hypocrea virens (strain Gv29-8 / FGSC 10586) TaxID=413071 RepID=G9NCK1_HYPVG|nr:uncharacterized protein TRIVIDRAFT_196278 [Trichoderma virens Gv29-8]EHK15424.1 hypothetical protein TRIVIDRAFT_196278 [Trichoderma virens Gv29-8]UKZ51366.1 hypothetical protein TrVGV298_005125 [Trichoderma virens]